MNVFSQNRSRITVAYGKNQAGVADVVVIEPGRNKVEDDVWEKVKVKLEKWLDAGLIRYSSDQSQDLKLIELDRMLTTPGLEMIRFLSPKTRSMSSGEDGMGGYLTAEQLRAQGLISR